MICFRKYFSWNHELSRNATKQFEKSACVFFKLWTSIYSCKFVSFVVPKITCARASPICFRKFFSWNHELSRNSTK